jgi:hypothetical protein
MLVFVSFVTSCSPDHWIGFPPSALSSPLRLAESCFHGHDEARQGAKNEQERTEKTEEECLSLFPLLPHVPRIAGLALRPQLLALRTARADR